MPGSVPISASTAPASAYAIGDLHQAAQRAPSDAAAQRVATEALGLLASCTDMPELSAARLRALAANAEDQALAEILKDIAAALMEGSALLTFGTAARRSPA